MDELSIRSEMNKLISEKIEAGIVVDIDWLTVTVMKGKRRLRGKDASFYHVHTANDIKRIAGSVVGKYDPTNETDDQLLLPGFKHLAKAYSMKRKGKIVLVPVDQCSDVELFARAKRLDRMSDGCKAHSLEIVAYVNRRNAERGGEAA